jgi:hypothetical protein
MRFQVLMAASEDGRFWDVKSYSLVHINRRFRDSYFFLHQGDVKYDVLKMNCILSSGSKLMEVLSMVRWSG